MYFQIASLSVAVVALFCVLNVGCNHSTVSSNSKANSIISVYRQIDASFAAMELDETAENEKWWQVGAPGVWNKHFQRLSIIDATRCPHDFQQAFEQYLRASKEVTDKIESTQGWGSWVANFATVGNASLIPFFLEKDEMASEFRAAQFNMKRSAIRHGVSFNSNGEDK